MSLVMPDNDVVTGLMDHSLTLVFSLPSRAGCKQCSEVIS